jgi:hypothetical protein
MDSCGAGWLHHPHPSPLGIELGSGSGMDLGKPEPLDGPASVSQTTSLSPQHCSALELEEGSFLPVLLTCLLRQSRTKICLNAFENECEVCANL